MNAAWRDWDAAFVALVRSKDAKPLAALLRNSRCSPAMLAEKGYALTPDSEKELADGGGRAGSVVGRFSLIPAEAALELAELLDPQRPWSRFAGPLRASDQIETVAGKKRLKAAVRLEAAQEAADDAGAGLVQAAKKLCEPLDEGDPTALEAFAQDRKDERALRAFADHKEALREWRSAKAAAGRAVRLVVEPLSKEQRERLERDGRIVAEMVAALSAGASVSEAVAGVGSKVGLKDRQVAAIWAAAKRTTPLWATLARKRRRRAQTR